MPQLEQTKVWMRIVIGGSDVGVLRTVLPLIMYANTPLFPDGPVIKVVSSLWSDKPEDKTILCLHFPSFS